MQSSNPREIGRVKKWNEKGFGFIERDDGSSVFCHASQTPGRQALAVGARVSFIYAEEEKGGRAVQVRVVEEAMVEENDGAIREMGTVKRWNAEKGFGFIGRAIGDDDAFVHKKDCGGRDLAVGQPVSFVFEQGPKGGSAKSVREEGEVAVEEERGIREFGKVKQYNGEKGFAFISRCVGGDDIFAHKKEFGSIEPYAGQPVSFLILSTEKGDAAKKVREEASVPDLPISDEGRGFGTIKDFNAEKGYGFIVRKAGGENARFFEKACAGITPGKGMCVSFVLEEGNKGPTANELREEDPERVARVTAKVHYGTVKDYFDPSDEKPTNGFGFIETFNPPSYGAPQRYYFHMSEIETPDEEGGIDKGTNVSFIVVPAKKGIQAAAVKAADPPVKKENVPAVEDAFGEMKLTGESNGTATVAADDAWDTSTW